MDEKLAPHPNPLPKERELLPFSLREKGLGDEGLFSRECDSSCGTATRMKI